MREVPDWITIRLNVSTTTWPAGAVIVLSQLPLVVSDPPDVDEKSMIVPVVAVSVAFCAALHTDTAGT